VLPAICIDCMAVKLTIYIDCDLNAAMKKHALSPVRGSYRGRFKRSSLKQMTTSQELCVSFGGACCGLRDNCARALWLNAGSSTPDYQALDLFGTSSAVHRRTSIALLKRLSVSEMMSLVDNGVGELCFEQNVRYCDIKFSLNVGGYQQSINESLVDRTCVAFPACRFSDAGRKIWGVARCLICIWIDAAAMRDGNIV